MLKRYSIILLFLSLLLSFALSKPVVTISTGEYAPWIGETLYENGFSAHIIKEAFNRQGYEVVFQFFPWQRAWLMFENCEVDASATWFKSEEKAKRALFSDPIVEEKIYFFYVKDLKLEWNNLENLSEYRIGATRGYTYTEEFWNLEKQNVLTVELANDDLINFKKLLAKRIDLFPANFMGGRCILKENFSPNFVECIKISDKALRIDTSHLLFQKSFWRSEELLKAFNEGLKSLHEDGTYDQYYEDMLNRKYSKQWLLKNSEYP